MFRWTSSVTHRLNTVQKHSRNDSLLFGAENEQWWPVTAGDLITSWLTSLWHHSLLPGSLLLSHLSSFPLNTTNLSILSMTLKSKPHWFIVIISVSSVRLKMDCVPSENPLRLDFKAQRQLSGYSGGRVGSRRAQNWSQTFHSFIVSWSSPSHRDYLLYVAPFCSFITSCAVWLIR